MSNFFQDLITDYIHSRPNARKLEPKHVAKRLGIRKRDFEEFLIAWRAIFQRGVASLEPRGAKAGTSHRWRHSTRRRPGFR